MTARKLWIGLLVGYVLLTLLLALAACREPYYDREAGRAVGRAEQKAATKVVESATKVVQAAETVYVRAQDFADGHRETSPFCSAVLAPAVGGGTFVLVSRRKRR